MSAQPNAPHDLASAAVTDAIEYIFEHYPHVARQAGRHEFDGRLAPVGPWSPSDLDGLRSAAERELRSLPPAASPELRADLGAALKVLEDQHFRMGELGQRYLGPLDWLAATDVTAYLNTPYAPLDERVAGLDAQLAAVPEYLRQGIRALGTQVQAGERMRAVEHARGQAAGVIKVVEQLHLDYPQLAAAHRMSAAAEVSAGCAEFADAVAATVPTKALYGPELLAEFLRAVEGIEHSVADLLEEARAEVASVLVALDSVAADLGVDSRQQAFELMTDQVSAGSVIATMSDIVAGARDFWSQQDILPVAAEVPMEIRPMSGFTGVAKISFTISAPFEQVRQPHVLWVPELPESAGPDTIRGQYLNDPMLAVIAVHETFAGHYLQAELCSTGPSVIRTCVPWFPGFSEGWAHYVEELAIEHGLAEGRPLVAVAQLKSALEAATRLLIFLSIHTRQWSFADAVRHAVEYCGWSMERAAREVLVVASDADGAMYALGKLRIREWRKTSGAEQTRAGLWNFHDRLLRCGNAPLSAAWRYYLDGQTVYSGSPS